MKNFYEVTDAAGRRAAWQLLAYGLWIRLALIAVLAVAGALVALVDGHAGLATPFAVAVLGAALAVLSWYRAGAIIKRLEGQSASAPAAPRAAQPRAVASPAAV